jgi:prevent-host-death family protein
LAIWIDMTYSWSYIQVIGCRMKLSAQIKPISFLKAHVSEIVRDLGNKGLSLVITQNGEAKAVLQDIHSYEQTQETLALLKILALGQTQVSEGKVKPLDDVLHEIKQRRRHAE